MNDIAEELAVTIRASIDKIGIKFNASGDGKRIFVSGGMKDIMHHSYWTAVQKTCPDLQPAGNNRQSVPTSWFMATTANPPTFVKAQHRRILRMVHLICRDALSEGASFRSDKTFSRETPALQIERNILESAAYWDPAMEADTSERKPAKAHRKKRRRSRSESDRSSEGDGDDSMPDDDETSSRNKRQQAKSMSLIKYPTRADALAYLQEWSHPEALEGMGLMKNRGLMMLMMGTTYEEFQKWLCELSSAWLEVQRTRLLVAAQLPLEEAKKCQEEAKKCQEEAKKCQEDAKRGQEIERTHQEKMRNKSVLSNNKLELWKAQTAKKEREDKAFHVFQQKEAERKRKQEAEAARLKIAAAREKLALDKQKRLDELEIKAAELAIMANAGKQKTSGMRIPTHGLPMVPNSAQVIAELFEGKVGVATCQNRAKVCAHSVMMLEPNLVRYIDEADPRLMCTPCAESATAAGELAMRSDLRVSDKHRLVWLNRNGFATSSKCQLCEQGAPVTVFGGWHCLHDIPRLRSVRNSYGDLFVGHEKCNVDQATSLLDDFRRVHHGLPPVMRVSALVAPAGSKLVNGALAFALDHRNPEKTVRARLRSLLMMAVDGIQHFLERTKQSSEK